MRWHHRATKSAYIVTTRTRTTKVNVVFVNVSSAASTTTPAYQRRRRQQQHRFVASTEYQDFRDTRSRTHKQIVESTSSRQQRQQSSTKPSTDVSEKAVLCDNVVLGSVKILRSTTTKNYIYINVNFYYSRKYSKLWSINGNVKKITQ